MSSIDRFLRPDQPDKAGRYTIMLAIYWQGNRVRLSSGEKCLPADWDEQAGRVRSRVKFAADINQRLNTYSTELERYLYQSQNAGIVVDEAMVRDEVGRIRTELLGEKTVVDLARPALPLWPDIDSFGRSLRAEMVAEKSASWQTTARVVTDHLLAFRPDLDWPGLTLSTLNLFKVYLQEELDLADSSLSAYIYILKGILKQAGRRGLPVPGDFAWLEMRRVSDPILPELTHPDLSDLREVALLDKTGHVPNVAPLSVYEDVRWYFGMAAGTGLRHSDLWQLQNPRLIRLDGVECLEAFQQKTGRRVPVPLNDQTRELLETRPTAPPVALASYNQYLKEVGKQAGWVRPVTLGTYYKGRLVAEVMPLADAANSHLARRTFATMMSAGGMPTRTLQEIMGHVSIASTGKYVKVSSATIIEQASEAWRRSASPLPKK